MGKIDREKEEIGWIKFWIGVSVASVMGLISWFVNHYEQANTLLLILDIFAVFILAALIILLNRIGLKKIRELEDLEWHYFMSLH